MHRVCKGIENKEPNVIRCVIQSGTAAMCAANEIANCEWPKWKQGQGKTERQTDRMRKKERKWPTKSKYKTCFVRVSGISENKMFKIATQTQTQMRGWQTEYFFANCEKNAIYCSDEFGMARGIRKSRKSPKKILNFACCIRKAVHAGLYLPWIVLVYWSLARLHSSGAHTM